MARCIHHANRIGTPTLDNIGRGGQCGLKAWIAHREVLGAMVKVAKLRAACGHASTEATTFLEDADLPTCLRQCACTRDTRHTCTDNGNVFFGGLSGLSVGWHGIPKV